MTWIQGLEKAAVLPNAVSDPLVQLQEIKEAAERPEAEAAILMQRLIQLMRKNPGLAGAGELYQQLNQASYDSHTSSPAHSHPPGRLH